MRRYMLGLAMFVTLSWWRTCPADDETDSCPRPRDAECGKNTDDGGTP